jgi:hypothetical protein
MFFDLQQNILQGLVQICDVCRIGEFALFSSDFLSLPFWLMVVFAFILRENRELPNHVVGMKLGLHA